MVELTEDLDRRGIEPDLLVRLAERRFTAASPLVDASAGEADLAGVRAQAPRPAGEHDAQLAVELVERARARRTDAPCLRPRRSTTRRPAR